jgi:hypothetical protein
MGTLLLFIAFLLLSGISVAIKRYRAADSTRVDLSSAQQYERALTDEQVHRDLNFELEVIKKLRDITETQFKVMTTQEFITDKISRKDTWKKIEHNGILFEVGEKKIPDALSILKYWLKEKGYLIFLAERNWGGSMDKLGVIKSLDQFDILRFRGTNGCNYSIDNEGLIQTLQRWNEKYPLEIIGADVDWVESIFFKQPENMLAFAEEVYKFCPDIVEQGTKTVEALAEEMKKLNTLYLWWD